MVKNNLILFMFIILLVFIIQCGKNKNNDIVTYDFMNAPTSLKDIADYENLLLKEEYNNLLNTIERIKDKYKVKIFIITATSFHGLSNEQIHYKRIFEIFNVNHLIDNSIIIEFSKKEGRFCYSPSRKFNKKINKEKLNEKVIMFFKKYFNEEKYYQGFKKMLEAIKEELQRNII